MAEILPANSVGIWGFGPSVTRFVPPGYHPEAAHESMLEKTKRVADGLADILDGLEYHYPGEAAVRQAILNWEFIWDVASKIDRRALADARERADAIAGVRTVYAALGLDKQYEAEMVRRRQKRREASRRKAHA